MLKSNIHVDLRNQSGTNACHKLRNRGHIPAVVYGHNINTKMVEVDKTEMDNIIRNYGTNALMDLCTGTGTDKDVVIIKEAQRDAITNELIHVDFQKVSYNDPIHAMIPIRLVGKQKVESSIGVVQQQLREIQVECLPQYMPESLEIDVAMLKPGVPLKVADIEFGGEISILEEKSLIVASLVRADKKIEEPESIDIVQEISGDEK
ncbi:50S ribosomal protein L25 [Lutibacter sp. B2]|nr:50S ribosomal protein L25 [Lutibacter sp. B2]